MSSSNIHVEKDTRITVTMPIEHAQKLVALLKPFYIRDKLPIGPNTGKLYLTDLGHALENQGVKAFPYYPFRIADGAAFTGSSR